jgi:hypothetical protein
MRRHPLYLSVLVVVVNQVVTARSDAQRVQFPPPAQPAYQPPPSALPYTTPAAPTPFATGPPANVYPPPTLPPATQPQAVQNLVGDAQRYGLPFDPYAQPAQYVGPPPAPPPAAVPYATTAPPPTWSLPGLPTSWGGFYAGVEATILEARPGGIGIPLIDGFPLGVGPAVVAPAAELDFFPEFDLEFSGRVWAGYKGAAGFGGRGRWWHYDHESSGQFNLFPLPVGTPIGVDTDAPPDAIVDANVLIESTSLTTNLRINSIDLEATQDGEFHNWDFQIAGGVRYAKIDYDLFGGVTGTIEEPIGELPANFEEFDHTVSVFSEFEGVGPTIAMGARRPLLFADGLAFLTNLRLAFLFGDSTASLAFDDVATNSIDFQELVQVWEVQVGFEYSRQLASGARLFGSAFLEAQVWEWGVPLGISGSDLGFFGPTVGVGIAR